MSEKNIFFGFLAIIFLLSIFFLLPNEKEENAYHRDYWSENCTEGTYAAYSGESYLCEMPRPCKSDGDCRYLEVNRLPPRTGKCTDNICLAECGSGVVWNC